MGEPSRVRLAGPLEPFAEGFIAELEEAGYRPTATAVQVRVLAHLSRWMQDRDVSPGELREPELERLGRRASRCFGEYARSWTVASTPGIDINLRTSRAPQSDPAQRRVDDLQLLGVEVKLPEQRAHRELLVRW
jgi:hypothetical protein